MVKHARADNGMQKCSDSTPVLVPRRQQRALRRARPEVGDCGSLELLPAAGHLPGSVLLQVVLRRGYSSNLSPSSSSATRLRLERTALFFSFLSFSLKL